MAHYYDPSGKLTGTKTAFHADRDVDMSTYHELEW